MDKKRFNNIDFLRFAFAELIVFYHITAMLMEQSPDELVYQKIFSFNNTVGPVIVSCFFVISGFFSYLSNDYKKRTLLHFIWHKVSRLWPVLFVSLIFTYKTPVDLLNMFFISSGTGLLTSGSSNPASWYICVLLFIEIASYLLFSTEKEDNSSHNGKVTPQLVILITLSFFAFVVIGQRTTSGYYALVAFEQLPMLTNGMLSGIAGYGLGYFIGFVYKNELNRLKDIGIARKIAISIVEAIAFVSFFWLVSFCQTNLSEYPLIFFTFLFVVIFIFFILKKGYVSKFFDLGISKILGSWSYAIYIMQWPCFNWLKNWIWKMEIWGIYKIGLSILFCTAVGIVTHYLFEVLLIKVLHKMKKH